MANEQGVGIGSALAQATNGSLAVCNYKNATFLAERLVVEGELIHHTVNRADLLNTTSGCCTHRSLLMVAKTCEQCRLTNHAICWVRAITAWDV